MSGIPSVTCVGELIVDFISLRKGVSLQEAPAFGKHAGGAAANVAVGVRKLGIPAAFAGRVGSDPFGAYLRKCLAGYGVDVSDIRIDPQHRTRLAFVSLTRSGERDFAFWEEDPADAELRPSDFRIKDLAEASIVHFSSFLLLREPSRSAALRLAAAVRRRGGIVSFDPNLRMSLWSSPRLARSLLMRMIGRCSVLRLNDTEAQFLAGARDLNEAMKRLASCGPDLVVVTRGRHGCLFRIGSRSGSVGGFTVRAADTTGCGDGFLAGLLSGIVRSRLRPAELPPETVHAICVYANAVGALTAMKPGVMDALPTATQAADFLLARKGKKVWPAAR